MGERVGDAAGKGKSAAEGGAESAARSSGSDLPGRQASGGGKTAGQKRRYRAVAILLVILGYFSGGRAAGSRVLPDDAAPAPGHPETGRREAARRKRPHRTVAVLLVAAAASAGVASAVVGRAPLDDGSTSAMRKCTAPAGAVEHLTIRAAGQPRGIDLSTAVTVKLGTAEAHDLLASTTGEFNDAQSCYFPDFFSAPAFLSAGKGEAIFSDETNDQNGFGEGFFSPGSGWTGSLQDRTVALKFSPADACASSWAGAPLTLTVDADEPLQAASPVPDRHSGHSYTWFFPQLDCRAMPGVQLSIPMSFPAYLAAELDEKTAGIGESWSVLTQWSAEIILLLFAVFCWVGNRRCYPDARLALYLVAVAAVGFAGVAAINIFDRPTSLVVVYGILLTLSLAGSLWRRLLAGAGAVGIPAVLLWLSDSPGAAGNYASGLTSVSVMALSVTGILCLWGRLRYAGLRNMLRSPDERLAERLDLGILYTGTVIVAAAAYSVPAWLGDLRLLPFLVPPFGIVLIVAALVIPLLAGGSAARRRQLWYGLLGFASLTGLPDPVIGTASIPVAEVLFAVILARICADKAPEPDRSASGFSRLRAGTPRDNPADNARLALKISAVLAVIPVTYFTVTGVSNLPSSSNELAPAFFLAAAIVGQIAGWLAAGVVFSAVNSRLPGWCGPVRALIISAVWLAVGYAVSNIPVWSQPGNSSHSWMFSGLQLLLFLAAFGAVWDTCILGGRLSWASLDELRDAYRLQQARSLVLYAVPVVLTLIALGQQVLSGSGVDFVNSALNVVPAVLGRT